jgi:hypothetical protein
MSAIGGKAGGLPASTYTTAKKVFGFVGGRTRTRTLDPLIKSQRLKQAEPARKASADQVGAARSGQ